MEIELRRNIVYSFMMNNTIISFHYHPDQLPVMEKKYIVYALVRRGALVPIGEGIGLSSPTGTKVQRQKSPLVPVEPTGTKGSFSPGWY
jgi:hypothetical protein